MWRRGSPKTGAILAIFALGGLLLLCIPRGSDIAVGWVGGEVWEKRWVVLDDDEEPQSVRDLEREAKKDVEDDATNAGLAALHDKSNSLAMSLTGGL